MASSSTPPPPLLYAVIGHGSTILVRTPTSTPLSASAATIADALLPKITLSPTAQKCTYTHNDFHLHTTTHPSPLLTAPLTFILVTTSTTPKQVAYNFLVAATSAFTARFTMPRVEAARTLEFDAEFGGVLQGLMKKYGDTKDIAREVRGEIENVRGIMSENIERVMERGDRIELLVDKTGRLEVGAGEFRRRSKGLSRRMWWKNVKMNVLLGLVIVFLIYIFVGFGCGLPGWSKCLSN